MASTFCLPLPKMQKGSKMHFSVLSKLASTFLPHPAHPKTENLTQNFLLQHHAFLYKIFSATLNLFKYLKSQLKYDFDFFQKDITSHTHSCCKMLFQIKTSLLMVEIQCHCLYLMELQFKTSSEN